ncbi:peptide chain release factor N(5)-glutamine methyltransferase [Marivibrio halodurans]|uniref:Release factor glutamine methyltransferase n=1 Tax=Marivibrio halodurans TaxID=2039722 RepID=A0A8J7SKS9_9PROT|nr:peptide chain release factor N(5)-glutamine methyltransferase [Marivibrio halodurans]MBP5856398.1 peptide chain release factor N(5)-glutamine methyltransferase [Marivibrio halodurans]
MAETTPPKTLGALLTAATARLAEAGVETPARDARLLLADAMAVSPAALIGAGRDPVSPTAAARFEAHIIRRAEREPVSRILGRRGFWTLDLAVDPAVLDPRADSETLVEAALDAAPDRARAWRVLDLGVGSGCLLLAVLSERPAAIGLGIDRSAAAAGIARANAAALGLDGRAWIAVGDWAAAVAGPIDLVLANPPYIARGEIADLAPEVAGHDPRLALDGGADGLDAYRAILAGLPRLLAPDGHAVFEVGAGQWAALADLALAAGFEATACRRDSAGIARVLSVRRMGKKRLGKSQRTG